MSEPTENSVPWILWPVVAVWRLVTGILKITGRIICAVLGLVFMVAGVTISLSVIGAPLGIPLAVFGSLLLVRALF